MVVASHPFFYTEIKSRHGNEKPTRSRPFAGHSRLSVCASVLLTLPPAVSPASPVAPALAPARGMIGRVLYISAFFFFLLHTMDSQPTDKVEGVGEDFVRGGHDKTPTQKKRNSYERTVVKAETPTATVTEGNEQYCALWIVKSPGGTATTYTDIQCRNRRRQNNRSNRQRRRKNTANNPNS
jgi:hypothetical protein